MAQREPWMGRVRDFRKMALDTMFKESNKREMFNKLNGIHSINLLKVEVDFSIYS